VQVSKSVLFVFGAAFIFLLAVLAFLLGRESARKDTAAGPPVAFVAPPAAPSPAAPPTPEPAPEARPLPDDHAQPPPQDAEVRAAVRQYFREMDQAQDQGSIGDPKDFAQKLLTGMMSGDTSGFDQVVRAANVGLAKARTLAPPQPCASYHQQMLKLLEQTTAMLVKLRGALQNKDPGAAATIASDANSLKDAAEALEQQEKSIKSRFGLD
jgi:hypothetical protein